MSSVDLIGDEDVAIEATLNGKPLKRRVKARQHLADFLRQELELTGTHLGCEHGICGACTVLIDGQHGARLPDPGRADLGQVGGDHRRPDRKRQARGAAEGVHRAQRRAMRLLLVRHAADRLRAHLERRNHCRARKSAKPCPATCAAAPAITPSSTRSKRSAPGLPRATREGIRSVHRATSIDRHRRPHPAARAEAAGQRSRPLYRRHQAAAHAARLFRAKPAPARQDRLDRHRSRETRAGRCCGIHRGRHQPEVRAVRRGRAASAGASFGAAIVVRRRPRRLAGPARRHRGRRKPGRGGGRRRARHHRMGAAARGGRPDAGHRARARPRSIPKSPTTLRSISRSKGATGQSLCRGRCCHRGGASFRAPDGDDAGDARPDRRFRPERGLAHRHPCASVAVSDAGRFQPPPAHSGAQGPRDCRRTSAAASA